MGGTIVNSRDKGGRRFVRAGGRHVVRKAHRGSPWSSVLVQFANLAGRQGGPTPERCHSEVKVSLKPLASWMPLSYAFGKFGELMPFYSKRHELEGSRIRDLFPIVFGWYDGEVREVIDSFHDDVAPWMDCSFSFEYRHSKCTHGLQPSFIGRKKCQNLTHTLPRRQKCT